MNPQKGDAPDPASLEAEKLESWKEIAAYLGKGVTTVRRWEREEGLPVRRQEHIKRGSVIAYRLELDAWRRTRTTGLESPTSRWSVAKIALLTALVAAVVVAGTAWTSRNGWNPTSEVRNLTAYPGGETQVSFAPGGQRFALAYDGLLMVKEVGKEPAREIYRHPRDPIRAASWSPDGSKIAVSHATPSLDWEITVVDADGRFPRHLGKGGPAVSWRHDSKAVVYAYRHDGQPSSVIYEHDLTTSRVRQISFPPPGSWGDIAGVPDETGRFLAIARYSRVSRGDLYTSTYGESKAVRLTYLQNWIVGLDWLPHGQGIVFDGIQESRQGLYRIAADGSHGPILIDGTQGINRGPDAIATGPSSIRIGFVHEFWDTDLKLFHRATGVTVPAARSTQSEQNPDISAGGHLVFQSSRTGAENLWVCSPGCEDLRQITDFRERQFDITPRWSPDGGQIAFTAVSEGRPSLTVIEAGGENPRILSEASGEAMPAWSANGQFLYFQSDRSGRAEIWRIPVSGGAPAIQITRGGGIEAHESTDGREIFFIRANETATVYRQPVGGGTESPVQGMPPVRRGNWRPVGNTILYMLETSREHPTLQELDLSSGKTRLIPTAGLTSHILGLSANAKGEIVWGESGPVHRDLQAVDLTFPPFWKRF